MTFVLTPTTTTPPAPTNLHAVPAVPRVSTSLLLALSVAASLSPSLLPRASLVQAVVTGLFAAAALVVSAVAHRITSRVHRTCPRPRARRVALGLALLTVGAVGIADAQWQNGLRESWGVPRVGPMYWIEVVCGSVSVCALLVVIGIGSARGAGKLGAMRLLATTAVVAVTISVFGFDWARDAFAQRYAQADLVSSTVQAHAVAPVGGVSVGVQGQRFLAGGEGSTAVRTYVGLRAAPTYGERAELAADELERSGGLAKAHVVIAVPTGSGWVDENAVRGFDERFGGDVATVALQYSDQPSWATFLFAEDAAIESTRALRVAVEAKLAALDEDGRPTLHIYGQSLGSVAGSAALQPDSSAVCSTLWAGPPANKVDTGRGVVLANTSDPVVWWSRELIFSPPDLTKARVDAPVPQWIPLVSFAQTSVDLLFALDAPAGHGHRYAEDQGTGLLDCG
ncbi:alpha/beta-hydrolase family protein [Rhodococcus sp. NPDC057297]|uniref:alpha/beta-hydrolase family protein n=1 Tax=Rhodococcus sp. NPDC057297 TaxID=3346090 RepID=UPI0036425C3D